MNQIPICYSLVASGHITWPTSAHQETTLQDTRGNEGCSVQQGCAQPKSATCLGCTPRRDLETVAQREGRPGIGHGPSLSFEIY
jgi:hypothetical protein